MKYYWPGWWLWIINDNPWVTEEFNIFSIYVYVYVTESEL